MSGPPMEYDPRRLFPFGLSPIPEVPSELASEVSSMYSYNPDDDDESEADTEVEGGKTPVSIMYSGSCSSVKSNDTLEDKAQAEDSSLDSGRDEESDNSGQDEEDSDDSENDSDESEDGEDRVIIEASLPLDEKEQILEHPKEAHNYEYDYNQQQVTMDNQEIETIQETITEVNHKDFQSTIESLPTLEVETQKIEEVNEHEEVEEDRKKTTEEEERQEQEVGEESSDSSESDDDDDDGCENCYSSQVTAVTYQRAFNLEPEVTETENLLCEEQPGLAIVPSASSSNLNPTPGAIAATEIFHHLQATRDKDEVTTELAKILSVLQTTLKDDDDDESSSSTSGSEESVDSKEPSPEPVLPLKEQSSKPVASSKQLPLGKPPVHPSAFKNVRKMGPEIQQRIRDLARAKPEKGKEEMSILSKILVTLLCSCKSIEATLELKKIIRHFKEAASEASDDVGDEILPLRSSRTSSRTSKRKRRRSRSRRSSANSNGSNTSQSEAESLTNTLTPCNTDSKSSGTDDEGGPGSKRCSVCKTPTNESSANKVKHSFGLKIAPDEEQPDDEEAADVTFTVSLPRRASIEVAEITASISPTKMLGSTNTASNIEGGNGGEEEEWDWEEDDDAGSGTSGTRSRRSGKRLDSTSSRELSSAELSKQDNSMASSTRKLLTEMEFGAYNSDSMHSPGHSGQSDDPGISMSEQSHESPALESDFNLEEGQNNSDDEEDEEEEEEDEDEDDEEENLYSHLEETYRVLNGTYQIITGAQTECTIVQQQQSTTTTIQSENVINNNTITTTTPATNKHLKLIPSRPSSKMSRPGSRRSVQNSKDDCNKDGNEEEDEEGEWEYYYEGDEEGEWEYYYEGDGNDQGTHKNADEPNQAVQSQVVENKIVTDPQVSKPLESMATTTTESKNNLPNSRPVSRQRKVPLSRPGSRTGSRPSSRAASKKDGLGEVQEEGEQDWEWEYYYEEDEDADEELERLSPTATTAPTTRATSPFPDQQQALKLILKHAEVRSQSPWALEALTNSRNLALPSFCRAFESFHADPDWYNPINELSVALAAEYLGQKSEEVAKALPADFIDTQSNLDKSEKTGSHHKSSSKRSKKKGNRSGDEGGETNSKGSGSGERKHTKKKKKKKGDGKFLPKITVRDLVHMLEPQLFKDDDTGTKMVMQEEAARSSIARQRKSRSRSSQRDPTIRSPMAAATSGGTSSSGDTAMRSVTSKTTPSTASPASPAALVQNIKDTTVEEPIKKEVVIIHDPKNPNQVEVCMDGQSTFVTMRPHSRRSIGARSKDSNPKKSSSKHKSGISGKDNTKTNNQQNSPSESEAYGTGSSVSEALEGSGSGLPGDEMLMNREDQPSRHSRLLKILQESEESSDCFNPCSPNSDHDSMASSLASLPHTGGVAVERKLSFRSMKSSGRESDGDSISGELLKPSPPSLRKDNTSSNQIIPQSQIQVVSNIDHNQQRQEHRQRYMNLNLQSCYNMDPITPSSSSELSTPSSPGYMDYTQIGSLDRRSSKRMSTANPPTNPTTFRNWPTDNAGGDYSIGGQETSVEDIMKRKSNSTNMTSPLARTLHESRLMSNASPLDFGHSSSSRGSPALNVQDVQTTSRMFRNSPAGGGPGVRTSSPSVQSPTFRHSPKLEQELMELGQLPPAATYSTSSLPRNMGHRWNK